MFGVDSICTYLYRTQKSTIHELACVTLTVYDVIYILLMYTLSVQVYCMENALSKGTSKM